jgi:hypothetical protein
VAPIFRLSNRNHPSGSPGPHQSTLSASRFAKEE